MGNIASASGGRETLAASRGQFIAMSLPLVLAARQAAAQAFDPATIPAQFPS
jgi:hypothetical protein